MSDSALQIIVSISAVGFTLLWFFFLANVIAKDHEQHVKRLIDLVRNQYKVSSKKATQDDR